MSDSLFFVFSALMLASAVVVIASRNPIHSAIGLIFSLFCMAGLFVLLEAFFLAAVQILVYAGAVMVLFLFVIMLLDLPAEARRRWRWAATTLGTVVAISFAAALIRAVHELPATEARVAMQGTVENVGRTLFRDYLLPFEITSLLLLAAMIGVILLSKKELK